MSIVIKTRLPFPGMSLTASGVEGPFAITSKIVKFAIASKVVKLLQIRHFRMCCITIEQTFETEN